MSHAEELRDLAAWFATREPDRGNAPVVLEAAAVAIVQSAGVLRATAFLLRARSDKSAPELAMFLLARADDLDVIANWLDPREES